MCGSAPASVNYSHNQQQRTIPLTSLQVIEKWGKGAIARRRLRKTIASKQLAGLKYPEWKENKLVASDQTLLSDKELFLQLDYNYGGKDLYWNNFFVSIGRNKYYLGQWKKDRVKCYYEGLGIIKFSDGSKYEGQTKYGLFNGKGRLTHSNGDIYQGQWKDGKANGYGVFVGSSGSMYKGEWLNDLYHGKGIESWNYNTIQYEGDFVNGKKTGKGKFEFSGNVYEGEFQDGQFHGNGKYFFAETQSLYEGNFDFNNLTGVGKMSEADGSSYEGDFVKGKYEGQGKKTWSNGNQYTGGWKNGLQHGPGKAYNAKSGKETAEQWREGKKWNLATVQEEKVNPILHYKPQKELREKNWNR